MPLPLSTSHACGSLAKISAEIEGWRASHDAPAQVAPPCAKPPATSATAAGVADRRSAHRTMRATTEHIFTKHTSLSAGGMRQRLREG